MTRLEKAMQIELEGLREKILKTHCPHYYGMKDRTERRSRSICDGNCEKCWSEEAEDDKD